MKVTTRLPNRLATPSLFRDNLDQWVDRFFAGGDLGPMLPKADVDWTPRLDFTETDAAYTIRLEAPGVAKKDLEVKIEGQVLTIRGTRSTATGDENEQYVWREREEGQFVRSLRLPLPVDDKKAEAKIDEGIVTITLPKQDSGISTHVPIK